MFLMFEMPKHNPVCNFLFANILHFYIKCKFSALKRQRTYLQREAENAPTKKGLPAGNPFFYPRLCYLNSIVDEPLSFILTTAGWPFTSTMDAPEA